MSMRGWYAVRSRDARAVALLGEKLLGEKQIGTRELVRADSFREFAVPASTEIQ